MARGSPESAHTLYRAFRRRVRRPKPWLESPDSPQVSCQRRPVSGPRVSLVSGCLTRSQAGPCQCHWQRSSGPASEFNLAVSRCARVALGPMGRASVVSGRLNQPRGRAALCLGSPKSARDLSRIQVARVSPCLVSQVRHGRGPNQHGLFLGSPESARRRAFQGNVAARVALPVVAQVSPGLVSGR